MANELPRIYTVTSLTREIRERLETHFAIVWVSGEVSNLRQASSGHIYFTLKDDNAQLRAVLFRGNHQYMRHKPQDGNKVLCRGRLTVWEQRGDYQLIVDYLEPLGMGALAQAFEALKARLAAEGLFDPAHKKPLPFLPRRLALVTSPTGAVVRDFLRLLKRRHPNIEVLIYPVRVQGAEAAGDIVRALDELNAYPGVEVIVMARGGGSLEDLWPFNEESVARAIFRSHLPVVSAVGHEVDFTIADFVADKRAATPSHAVELVVPDKAELSRRLDCLAASLYRGWTRHLQGERRHLLQVARRLPDMRRQVVDLRLRLDERGETLTRRFTRGLAERRQEVRLAGSRLFLLSPGKAVTPARQRLEQFGQRLLRAWHQGLGQHRRHLAYCESHLDKLDPMSILQRGYAVATKLPEGTIIRDALTIPPGAEVRVQVAKGRMDCQVVGVEE